MNCPTDRGFCCRPFFSASGVVIRASRAFAPLKRLAEGGTLSGILSFSHPSPLPLIALLGSLASAITPAPSVAAEPQGSAHPLAILQRNCVRCHTEDKRKGGLLMTNRDALLEGGDSGPAFEAGQSGGSLLIETLFPDAENHMPPKGQLSPTEIETLANWIDAGAPWDAALWDKLRLSPLDGPVTLTALPPAYQPVFAVALSPDGKTLAAGRGPRIEWLGLTPSADGKTLSFTSAGTAEPGPDPVQSLAWSPDGKLVAAGSFRRVTIWDAVTRQKKAELSADLRGRVSALAFTPDSKTLLAADSVDAASGLMLNLDPATAKITRTTEAHRDTIFAIAVSPDGKKFATVSADKSARVWAAADAKPIHTLEGHTGYVLSATFSPTGDRLATGGDDEVIKIWLLETGKQVANFGGVRTGPVTALAWSVDPEKEKQKAAEKDPEKAKLINTDRIAAVNESGQPRVYSDLKEHEGEQTSTGARERNFDAVTGEELTALALDPATRRMFAGSTRGSVVAWEENGKIAVKSEAQAAPLAQAKP